MAPQLKTLIAPSILAADFVNFQRDVKRLEQAGADLIHCDIMDGCFVDAITFGHATVAAVKGCTDLPLDVHLMIVNPLKHVANFAEAGAQTITIHAEAVDNVEQAIDTIRATGTRVGIAVNPDHPIDLFTPYIEKIDQVLIMTVFAGKGGQSFIREMMEKVSAVRVLAETIGKEIDIQVDGGIDNNTAAIARASGANILVAGTYVFKGESLAEQIVSLRP